jgi:hypothetical protein
MRRRPLRGDWRDVAAVLFLVALGALFYFVIVPQLSG